MVPIAPITARAPDARPLPFTRRAGLAALGTLLWPRSSQAGQVYRIDHRSGRFEFTVHQFGVIPLTGRFEDFEVRLLMDPREPLSSRVEVAIRTAAVSLALPGASALLRSPAFFDSEAYPEAAYQGGATGEGSPTDFPVAGELTLRGVTQPQPMRASLIARRHDPALGREIASFLATGSMNRAAFGMTSSPGGIGDRIRLALRASLVI